MAGLLCVCGLSVEARIARRAGFPAVVGAARRQRTEALVAAALARVDCLVSFGIAGALSPALRPGDLLLSAEIVSEAGAWRGDADWLCRLAAAAAAIGARGGRVLGTGEILATPAEKARALARHAALAVDLESDIVAEAATRAGIRFAALRAIADPAGRALPAAARIPLAAGGGPDLARILLSLLREPRQAVPLIALARDARQALNGLKHGAPALRCLAGR